MPTVGNVHEIADKATPDSRCVYVHIEPVAVAHSQVLLERAGDPERHAVPHGDLRNVADIWQRAMATEVLDPQRPIGLIAVGVLCFLGQEGDPHEVIARYRDLLPAGSYLLVSHMTLDGVPAEGAQERAEMQRQYARSNANLRIRGRDEFPRFFDGFHLVDPGVTRVPGWRSDERPSRASAGYPDNLAASSTFATLGRKG